jgi:hypothetical protein
VNDRVEFEVTEEIRVAGTLIIPKGGIAWGTVTEAQHKRRLGRGGKLEIVMDSVRLVDGKKAPLRATKEAQGGGHKGVMTAGIVATGLIFWPVAPVFLFMHGNFALDMAKFKPAAPTQTPVESQASNNAEVAIASTPGGADIEVDGAFVGNTPSTIAVTAGNHTITLKKAGFSTWERTIKVSGGNIHISAELQASDGTPTQPAQR